MSNNIIITGSTGFIGVALTKRLKELGYSIVELNSINSNLTDISFVNNLPKASIFIHLAAMSSVIESWQYPQKTIDFNLLSTHNVMNYCIKNDCELIFPSTFLYKSQFRGKYAENMELEAQSPYSISKLISEQLCLFYSTNFGLKVNILRLFNMYGPGQKKTFLIPKIISQVLSKKEISVQNLDTKRDYVYIDDAIDAFIAIIDSKRYGGIYNICSGESYSVGEVISLIVSSVGLLELKVINENTNRPNEIYDSTGDYSRAKIELNWSPKISFETGIKMTIEQHKYF